ncbi:hypothetical protein DFH08DRAFT_970263 [Mycena albidolilacea]|uniref:Uncharacterized protein n=1 Tax=Mycena albidolilacea TaxID=1033008 RepID=A0AAD7EFN6_9AGAR|nr:hypothetical protein DFH08DRAFT_970263 [Mycena albidolilacea]
MLTSLFKYILVAISVSVVSIVSAIPTVTDSDFPEVIPGPGLPSLASLGLTSEELYKRVPTPEEMKRLQPLFTLECGEVPPACPVANAVACFNFLNALGTTACTVNGENVTFCTSGSCHWFGSNISGGSSASSFCRDVATGGNAVINTCQGNGFVDGANAASGNGNLIVTISAES